eukprot:8071264-Pyramimonas_sp.AAC.1
MRNDIRKGRTAATVKAKHTSVSSTSRETEPSLYQLLEGQISNLEAQVTPAKEVSDRDGFVFDSDFVLRVFRVKGKMKDVGKHLHLSHLRKGLFGGDKDESSEEPISTSDDDEKDDGSPNGEEHTASSRNKMNTKDFQIVSKKGRPLHE